MVEVKLDVVAVPWHSLRVALISVNSPMPFPFDFFPLQCMKLKLFITWTIITLYLFHRD